MLALLIAATLGGGCQASTGYGYARQAYVTYGATPTYYTPTYYTPTYQAPAYQAPQVDYKAVVGEYLREEYRQKAQEEQAARLARIESLLGQMKPQPVQAPAPQPQFQAPYPSAQAPSKAPPVQYEQQQPYPTAQQPTKAPPSEQFQYPGQPSQQYPSQQQQWAPQDQPPYAEKPSPAPSPPTPSFGQSSWVPLPQSGSGGGAAAQAVALMTAGMQARCTNCHVGTSSEGGGVKLLELDGTLADITPYLGSGEGGIEKAITSGRMPKRGPRLNNQELYAFMSGLRAYEAQVRARQNVVASFGQ